MHLRRINANKAKECLDTGNYPVSARLGLAIDEHDARVWILVDQRVHKGHAHGARAHDKVGGFEAFHRRVLRRCATTEVILCDGVLGSGLDQVCHFRAADETAEGDEERREVRALVHFVLPVRDSHEK
jgi:hypothetical protein